MQREAQSAPARAYGGNLRERTSALFTLLLLGILVSPFVPLGQSVSAHEIPPGTAPVATFSYYMGSVSFSKNYTAGCEQGHRSRDYGPGSGIAVLAFGQPWYDGTHYGAFIYDDTSSFKTTDQIASAVEAFASGFWACTPLHGPHITIAIGISNLGSKTNYANGQAWAQLVNNVANYVNGRPGWYEQITIVGASDMEIGFNTPAATRDWINGYNNNYSNHIKYDDFGDAAGCYPYNGGAGDRCGDYIDQRTHVHTPWYREDVWYKSWGARLAWPLPEIYFTVNNGEPRLAGVWQKVSLYAVLNHTHKMNFDGVITQYDACGGNGVPSSRRDCYASNGTTFTNSPSEGWTQLQYKLNNNDPGYHGQNHSQDWCTSPSQGCHRTDWQVNWATDLSYKIRD